MPVQVSKICVADFKIRMATFQIRMATFQIRLATFPICDIATFPPPRLGPPSLAVNTAYLALFSLIFLIYSCILPLCSVPGMVNFCCTVKKRIHSTALSFRKVPV
jgi:hypothetical protein